MSDAAVTKPVAVAKPKVSKPVAPMAHPHFNDLVQEAIVTLKERTGSSLQAILKVIKSKYGSKLKTGWEKNVSMSLKRMSVGGKLVKVKASYKLGEALKKAPKKVVIKKKAVKVKKASVIKPKAKTVTKAKKAAVPKSKKAVAPKAKKASAPKAKKAAAPKAKKVVAAKGGVKKVKTAKKATVKKVATPKA